MGRWAIITFPGWPAVPIDRKSRARFLHEVILSNPARFTVTIADLDQVSCYLVPALLQVIDSSAEAQASVFLDGLKRRDWPALQAGK